MSLPGPVQSGAYTCHARLGLEIAGEEPGPLPPLLPPSELLSGCSVGSASLSPCGILSAAGLHVLGASTANGAWAEVSDQTLGPQLDRPAPDF